MNQTKIKNESSEFEGIGGWLILYTISLGLGIIFTLSSMGYFIYGPYFLVILYFIHIILSITCLILIFRGKKESIIWNKIFLVYSFALTIVSALWASFRINEISPTLSASFRIYSSATWIFVSAIVYVIWFLYWTMSRNVNETFVR